ncbi:redoxin domain-containing protein [Lentibacillus sp. L22]|uniref:redoxin domain-containing protein n=1 Tax=Lentibacillus TaxID=175304 RepID=UPI0022B1F9BC|nr:redoxin domain-containing protein [Lentibacillus daqui]
MKQILGIAVIALLAGILIFNFTQRDNDQSKEDKNEKTVTVNDDMETEDGAAIVSPDSTSNLEPGSMAPDIELETLEGQAIKLSDLKGKKVFLNFWATWCPPCKEEMPDLQKFYDEHKDDVEIVAVNLTGTENKESDVPKFIDKYDYTFPIYLDKDLSASNTYTTIGIPTTYFIGTDGKIQQPAKSGPMTYDFMNDMLQSLK